MIQLDGAGTTAERFDSDPFMQRVSEREQVDLPVSVFHARVVLEVLQQAVSRGEIDKLRGRLPGDFQRLFEGSEGKMPHS